MAGGDQWRLRRSFSLNRELPPAGNFLKTKLPSPHVHRRLCEHGGHQAASQWKPQPLLTSTGQVPSALGSSPMPSCPKSLRPPTRLLPSVASGGSDGSCRRPHSRMYLGWPPARLTHRSSQHLAVLGLGRPLGPLVRPIPLWGFAPWVFGLYHGPYSHFRVRLLPRVAPSIERGSSPSGGPYSP